MRVCSKHKRSNCVVCNKEVGGTEADRIIRETENSTRDLKMIRKDKRNTQKEDL